MWVEEGMQTTIMISAPHRTVLNAIELRMATLFPRGLMPIETIRSAGVMNVTRFHAENKIVSIKVGLRLQVIEYCVMWPTGQLRSRQFRSALRP
jgi:hypothetical protein